MPDPRHTKASTLYSGGGLAPVPAPVPQIKRSTPAERGASIINNIGYMLELSLLGFLLARDLQCHRVG